MLACKYSNPLDSYFYLHECNYYFTNIWLLPYKVSDIAKIVSHCIIIIIQTDINSTTDSNSNGKTSSSEVSVVAHQWWTTNCYTVTQIIIRQDSNNNFIKLSSIHDVDT